MWKWIVGVVLFLLIALGVGGYFVATSPKFKEMMAGFQGGEKPLEVRLETASRGKLTRTISAPGLIEARTKVKIRAQVSARITALPFREGQVVKEGDVLVRLDAVELTANLDSSKASLRADEARLEGSQASLTRSKAELDRVRSLHKSGDRSNAELESVEAQHLQAESGLRVAEQLIESSRAQVRRSERDLANSVLTSPISGTVTRVYNEVGELVLGTFNNEGQTIVEVADLSVIIMKAEVDESNIDPVKIGQAAKVTINAYPDREFTGTVDQIALERQTGRDGKSYFETEIVLELKDGAVVNRLNGAANCDIAVETLYDVIMVPSQAVLDRRVEDLEKEVSANVTLGAKGKAFTRVVYKVVDGKSVPIPVTTGSSDLTSTVILSGLEPDDKVIAGPYKILTTLKGGQKVAQTPKPGEAKPGEAKPEEVKTETADASKTAPANPPPPSTGN